MAQLIKLGDYEGPGEQLTAEHLARVLPDAWYVIPGRKLPEKREDLDILVVGSHLVFVIEEKHWGPTVVVGDQTWRVVKHDGKAHERSNPLSSAAAKARKVAGWLRREVPSYKNVVGRTVEGAVVLSYPGLNLRTTLQEMPVEVMGLDEAADLLEHLDKNAQDKTSGFQNAREAVLKLLIGAESSPDEVRQIENYRIRAELSSEKGLRTFEGEHVETGDLVWLKAFDMAYWSKLGKNPEQFISHELRVLQNDKLRDAARVWTYSQPFVFDQRNWYVIPMNKPRDAISVGMLNSDDSRNFYKNSSKAIVRDAFAALASLHESNVVHRAISPDTVWLCKGLRVKFNDLNFSHVDGLETVSSWYESQTTSPYADDDAQRGVVFATKESDVYALGYVLAEWLSGISISDKAGIVASLKGKGNEQPYSTLLQALNEDPSPERRLTATAIVSQLQMADDDPEAKLAPTLSVPLPNPPASRSVLGFEVEEELGKGAVGTTYRVVFEGQKCVLKVPNNVDLFRFIDREAEVARALDAVQGVSRVIEKSKAPQPGFLLLSYAAGETLNKFAARPDFNIDQARVIAKNALTVLGQVHQQSFLHGDLSPRNIIVDEDLKVTLIDFGLGRRLLEKSDGLGTPLIVPPEYKIEYNEVSELYSFAVAMTWSMLNRSPYVGPENAPGSRDSSVVPLSSEEKLQWGDEASAFITALLQACDPNPLKRPQSAGEFIDLLHRTNMRDVAELPSNLERQTNVHVANLRGLYIQSSEGAPHALGLGTDFARETYIETQLDRVLLPRILDKKETIVFLTGNPGDGKTAFLQRVDEQLANLGASKKQLAFGDSETGWEYKHAGHRYLAIYDASEGWDEQSADQIVAQALRQAYAGDATALFAINDGRLLQFFVDHENEFSELEEAVQAFFAGESADTPGFLIVDLKTRGVVDSNLNGLAKDMLAGFTDEGNWNICKQCKFEAACPINSNRQALAGASREPILNLLRISHLRRLKRRTLRQIRSTLGWLITSDLSCQDVEKVVLENRTDEHGLDRLVFEAETEDQLIQEWRELDPGSIIAPEVVRYVKERKSQHADTSRRDAYVDFMRKAALGLELSSDAGDEWWQKYRHLDAYSNALDGIGLIEFKRKLLLGISRLQGLAGFVEEGLAFQVTTASSKWAVVTVLDESEFKIKIPQLDKIYLEAIPDRLDLEHARGTLQIHLDLAELVLRAADGMVLGKTQNPRELSEISAFVSKLRQTPAHDIQIIRPSGAKAKVSSKDGKIELISDGGNL